MLTFLSLLQVAIFAMGIASVAIAIRYVMFFASSGHHVAGSMRALLWEQVTSSGGTLIFSANSLLATVTGTPESEWNNINAEWAIAIRAAMFGMMIHATWRMSSSVRRILEEHDE